MKKQDFENLVESVRQAGAIRRGEAEPSRVSQLPITAVRPRALQRREFGMLRYFVAGNCWLLFALLLLVGGGDAGSIGPDTYRSFFDFGKLPTVLYVPVVLAALGLAAWYLKLYRGDKLNQIATEIRRSDTVSTTAHRQPLSDRVKQLAGNSANKIQAIAAYREETGASLAEAKDAVEEFIRSR